MLEMLPLGLVEVVPWLDRGSVACLLATSVSSALAVCDLTGGLCCFGTLHDLQARPVHV